MKRKVLFSVVRYPCRQCILLRVLTKLSMASHSSRGKSNHREPSPGFRLFEYNSVTPHHRTASAFSAQKCQIKIHFFFVFSVIRANPRTKSNENVYFIDELNMYQTWYFVCCVPQRTLRVCIITAIALTNVATVSRDAFCMKHFYISGLPLDKWRSLEFHLSEFQFSAIASV